MTTQLFQSGGVQTTVILPQIIYLDFDGELTRYNGELLSIDNVTVENSGLTEERIAAITAMLNQQFRDQNVEFVTEKPASGDYSTIFIGKTSSFEPYGTFAGLAETVDSGNRIHNDNAFVMLDSLSSNDRITDVIAHEAGHLLGTLDHGGEGLTRYARDYNIFNGATSTKITLFQQDLMRVYDGGTAVSTTINSGGRLYTSNTGIVNSTTIDSCGSLWVCSGGTANDTTINYSGCLCVSSGGTANRITLNRSGYLWVDSCGTVNSVRINSGGKVCIYSNGAANRITISSGSLYFSCGGVADIVSMFGGWLHVSDGGVASKITVNSGGNLYIADNGTADNTVMFGGDLYVSSGGITKNTTINSSGRMYVSDSGTANDTTINSNGMMHVSDSAIANRTTINTGGNLYVSNGIVNCTTVNSDGGLYILSSGVANSTTVNPDGKLFVSSYGTAAFIKENGGYVDCDYGARITFISNTFNGLALDGISATVHSGTTANKTTVDSDGKLYIFSGGIVNSATVNSGGNLHISSGGTAAFIKENGGYVDCDYGARITFISNTFNGLALEGVSATVHSGTTANNTTVDSDGKLYVFSDGIVNSVTVNSGGNLHISSGGTATFIRENGGYVNADYGANVTFVPGIVSGLSLRNTWATVHSGTTANSTAIHSGGKLYVYSGGILSCSLQIDDGAAVYAHTGAIIDFTVAEQKDRNIALINDWSRISGRNDAIYTLTLSPTQETGTYILAGAAELFNKAVSVKDTIGQNIGVLTVGESFKKADTTYFLYKNNSNLILTVGENSKDTTPPVITLSGDTETPASSVSLTASADDGSPLEYNTVARNYSGTWTKYTGTITVKSNGTYYFRSTDSAGNTGSKSITFANISSYDNVKLYSGGNLVSQALVMSGKTVSGGGSMFVSSGGTADSITVNRGGCIQVSNSGNMRRIVVSSGSGTVTSGALASGGSSLIGGAYCNMGGIMNVDGGIFSSNKASDGGGAVYQTSGASADIRKAVFSANSAASDGGAVFNNASMSQSSGIYSSNRAGNAAAVWNRQIFSGFDVNFIRNSASNWGGAVCNNGEDAQIYLSGCSFVSNYAGQGGGALHNCVVSKAELSNVVFSGNYAGQGGAVFNRCSTAVTYWDNVQFLYNSANNVGALYTDEKSVDIMNTVSFIGNTARENGALATVNTTLSGTNVYFRYNSTTAGHGGALNCNGGGIAKLINAEFTGNYAKTSGGGVIHGNGIVTLSGKTVFNRNSAGNLGGAIENKSVLSASNVQFNSNTAGTDGGAIHNISTGVLTLTSCFFTGNYVGSGSGGAIFNTQQGSLTISGGSFIRNSAGQGGAILHQGGIMQITSAGFSGNRAEQGGAIYVCTGASASLTDVSFLTVSDTIVNNGTIDLSGRISIAGNIAGNGTFSADDADMILDISSYNKGNAKEIISNLSKFTDVSSWSVTVNANQASGTYILAKEAGFFRESVSIRNTECTVLGIIEEKSPIIVDNKCYSLLKQDGVLSLCINSAYPCKLQGSEDAISWDGAASAYRIEYSTDQFQRMLSVQTAKCGIDTFAMQEGSYQWRVRNSDSETWAESVFAAEEKTAPESYASEANGIGDIFFADGSDVWESGYAAQHVGYGTWSGTGEQAELAGKNKITDVFAGSSDANILVMTDDGNGDALFVDDIYSAFPDEQQARIAQIDEIRAGAGDDIVDMTSQQFAYSGDGVTIRGGDGNDVIWANSGDNKLFGDAGDDRIVGASGNDVLVGGTGDDSMHGGGGNDIFCFCKGWGTDTVEQLSGGSVTLWFADNSGSWDQSTMTYTQDGNTVKITGVTQVTLKFGDDGSTQYDELLADGAFMEVSSEKIWEESGKGVLAKL